MKPDSPLTPDDPRLTAFALGELEGAEQEAVAAALAADPRLRQAVEQLRAEAAAVRAQLLAAAGRQPARPVALEAQILARLEREAAVSPVGAAHSQPEYFPPPGAACAPPGAPLPVDAPAPAPSAHQLPAGVAAASALPDAPSPNGIDWKRALGREARRPVVWWSPYALPLAACFVAVATVGLLWWNGFTGEDSLAAPARLAASPPHLAAPPPHTAAVPERFAAESNRFAAVPEYPVAASAERSAGSRAGSAADGALAKASATASFADMQRPEASARTAPAARVSATAGMQAASPALKARGRGEVPVRAPASLQAPAEAGAIAVAHHSPAASAEGGAAVSARHGVPVSPEGDTVVMAEAGVMTLAGGGGAAVVGIDTVAVAEDRAETSPPVITDSPGQRNLFAPRVWAYRRSGRAVRTSALSGAEGAAQLAEAPAERTPPASAVDGWQGSGSATQLTARGLREAQPAGEPSVATAVSAQANPAGGGAAFDITALLPAFTTQRSAANNGPGAGAEATGNGGDNRSPASVADAKPASPAVTAVNTAASAKTAGAAAVAALSEGEGAHPQVTALVGPLPARASVADGGATQGTSVTVARLLAEAKALVRPIEGGAATGTGENMVADSAESADPVAAGIPAGLTAAAVTSGAAGSYQEGSGEVDADNGESGQALGAPLTPEQAGMLAAARHFSRASLAELEEAAFGGGNHGWKVAGSAAPAPGPALATSAAPAAVPLQAVPAASSAVRQLNLANRYVQMRLWIEAGQLPPASAIDVDAIVRDAAQTYASGALRRLRVRSLPVADGEITVAELDQLEAQSPLLQSVRAYAVLLKQRPADAAAQLDALIAQVAERSKVAGSRSARDFLKLLRSTRTLF